MNLLLPCAAPADDRFWTEAWPAFLQQTSMPPGAPVVMDFLDAFSKKILLDPGVRGAAAFAALAHWARRGHQQHYVRHLAALPGRRAACGVVLNLAPANVDTLFAYAWFASLLCGNATIVRVSSRSRPVIAPLLDILRGLLAEPRFAAVRDRTLLVSYEHDEQLTTRLSGGCQARLIWGGDETVRAIRALPLPATAREIAFGDRFSLAAFPAAHITALEPAGLQRLAEGFCRDAFTFGQKACASPRAVIFTGDAAACVTAAARFWPAVQAELRQRPDGFGEADGITRLAAAMALSTTVPGARVTLRPTDGTPPLVLLVPAWPAGLRDQHDGAGLFVQLDLPALAALAPHLTARDQTLVTAGFTPAELAAFTAHLPARAIDRIVAPGQALDFDPTAWDGHDLLSLLTREITFS